MPMYRERTAGVLHACRNCQTSSNHICVRHANLVELGQSLDRLREAQQRVAQFGRGN